jgi:hypothetical protein
LEIVTVEEFIHYITPAVISGTRELLPERCVGTSGIVPDIYTDSNREKEWPGTAMGGLALSNP